MLQPKRTKFRKQMKGRNRGLALRGGSVSFGEYGLKAVGRGRITARQIEAARRAMTRHVKRGGKNIFTYLERWLKTGLITPRVSSMIEHMMREISRRLKRIATPGRNLL